MTRDDIIRMAREAGFHKWYTQPKEHPDHVAVVTRFAALIRAAALEEAAQKCDDLWQEDGTAYDCREAIRELKEKT